MEVTLLLWLMYGLGPLRQAVEDSTGCEQHESAVFTCLELCPGAGQAVRRALEKVTG